MASETAGLTQSQWNALKAGPVHMFVLVATADSYADQREWTAFVEAVRSSANHPDGLVRELMIALAGELNDGTITKGERDGALEGLREIRSILESLPDAGSAFSTALFEVGIAVAESSGAQLTRTFIRGEGLGWTKASGTSAVEHAALEAAIEALGLA
jgi:hypothetical protein